MLNRKSIFYPLRKCVARIVARKRLRNLKKNYSHIYIPKNEMKSFVDSLSEAMCESGIFKPRRIRNFKKKFCAKCLYRKECVYGEWCILRDCWMREIKDEYCSGFTERK